jgi:hypothetical protein
VRESDGRAVVDELDGRGISMDLRRAERCARRRWVVAVSTPTARITATSRPIALDTGAAMSGACARTGLPAACAGTFTASSQSRAHRICTHASQTMTARVLMTGSAGTSPWRSVRTT